MLTVSIHGSHHAAVALEHEGKYFILEAEQLLNRPASGLTHFDPIATPVETAQDIYLKLRNDLGISSHATTYLYNELGTAAPFFVCILQGAPAKCYLVGHHQAHAANSFYQSPFEEALVVTCDSGGDDGVFNIYLYQRGQKPERLAKLPLNLGYTYSLFGNFLKPIKESLENRRHFLSYSHKLMNLAPFGDVHPGWLTIIEKLFRAENLSVNETLQLPLDPYNMRDLHQLRNRLSELLLLPLHEGLDGMQAYDLAATVQRALENIFMAAIRPYLEAYPSLPVCLGGGVAKNIYLTRRVKQDARREVFVPLNPDNSGIALGMILEHSPPAKRVDFSHSGPHLLDLGSLNSLSYGLSYFDVCARQVGILLADGKILGIARGKASHGAYSLGTRSFVADASAPNIGPVVRWAINHSHDYIPFDALVRMERLSEYIESDNSPAYPNYPHKLKPKYRTIFPGITHIDGTVRIYAVDKSKDPWLHEVLRWFETYSEHGILLTAPLAKRDGATASTIQAGLDIFNSLMIEGLVVENRLFYKIRPDRLHQKPSLNIPGIY